MIEAMVLGWAVAVQLGWLLGKSWRRESELERELHEKRINLGLAPAILSLPDFSPDDEEGHRRYREWAGLER